MSGIARSSATTITKVVAQSLEDADGVLLVDESSVGKQGHNAVGVAPQYCGAVGNVTNCQVGVYLRYASAKGYSLLDAPLYLPNCGLLMLTPSCGQPVAFLTS